MLPSSAQKVLTAFQEAQHWQHTGEVVLRSGEATGRIFFAGGKIAWATASTLTRNFTHYMVEKAGLDEVELKKVYEDCKRTGKNFGEAIVESGLLDEVTLRQLLLEQIADSVLELFAWSTVDSMFVPGHRTYKGTLTYEVAEVLQKVLEPERAARLPFHAASVEELLKGVQPTAPRPRLVFVTLAAAAALAAISVGAWLTLGRAAAPLPPGLDAGSDAPAKEAGATPGAIGDAGTSLDAGFLPELVDAGSRVFPLDAIVAYADGDGRGAIAVRSTPPKATVFLDGVSTGLVTPAVLTGVAAGRDHLVLVDKEGLNPAFTRLTLKKNERAQVQLTPSRGRPPPAKTVVVRIESEPPGATVVVDGIPFKQLTPVDLKVSVRKVSILVVLRDGYLPWVRNVRPAPAGDLTLFARLKHK